MARGLLNPPTNDDRFPALALAACVVVKSNPPPTAASRTSSTTCRADRRRMRSQFGRGEETMTVHVQGKRLKEYDSFDCGTFDLERQLQDEKLE